MGIGKDENTTSHRTQELLDFLPWPEELVKDKKDILVTDNLQREFIHCNSLTTRGPGCVGNR